MTRFFIAVMAVISIGSISEAQFNDPSFPPNVPQLGLSNTTYGYAWAYAGTDNNGCNSCGGYSPQKLCGQHSVGQRMKSRVPGTNNNDYKYECRPVQMFPGQDLRSFQNLPWNGPQYFQNTVYAWQWIYLGMDHNGCHECTRYVNLQTRVCGPEIEGLKMARRQQGSSNNDFTFQCIRVQ